MNFKACPFTGDFCGKNCAFFDEERKICTLRMLVDAFLHKYTATIQPKEADE